jgi:hypothetical protein
VTVMMLLILLVLFLGGVSLGHLSLVALFIPVGLYVDWREWRARRRAQAELRNQLTGVSDQERKDIDKLLAENFRKAGIKWPHAWLADGGLGRREIPDQMNAHKHHP